jgi:hypothetical protein
VIVTSAADPGDAMFDVFAFEFAFVAFVRVTRAGNEVMASE